MTAQLSAELATAIVATFVLEPEETIVETRAGKVAVSMVTTHRGLRVDRIDDAARFHSGPGYTLFTVRDSIMDGASPVDGIAVLEGGEMHHLNDPAGLRAFFTAMRAELEPLELAVLVTTFQSTALPAESVITAYDDLTWFFPGADLGALPFPILPDIDGSPASELHMRYCSLYSARDSGDPFIKVNMNSWQIEVSAGGSLTWETAPLARNLESPRYHA